MGPVSQALYPFIVKKTSQSKKEGLMVIKKVTFYTALFTGLLSLFILIYISFC